MILYRLWQKRQQPRLSKIVRNGRQLLLVGACGNEDWQMLPFCLDAQSGIVSDCENAKEYRKLIGLQI